MSAQPIRLAAIAGLLLIAAGCSSGGPHRDAAYAPVRPVAPPVAPEGNGSIYQASHAVAWFQDKRARRVGDLLTVILSENTSANKSAKSATKKDNSNKITPSSFLGSSIQFNAPGVIPLASNVNNSLGLDLSTQNSFKGEGSASQSNAFSGQITVTVVEVLPNQNLIVRGEKRIGINQGNEYIRLSGIVRPLDITPDNTVQSTRLADPTISYSGDGAVAESNTMGWLARFFNSELAPL